MKYKSISGNGTNTAPLSDITKAVIDVIGKDSCGMDRIGAAEQLDSACLQLRYFWPTIKLFIMYIYCLKDDYTHLIWLESIAD